MTVMMGPRRINLIGHPNECPLCHRAITPKYVSYHFDPYGETEVFFSCPSLSCGKSFIGYYGSLLNNDAPYKNRVSPLTFKSREFGQEINTISPQFELIWNESSQAEQQGYSHICGVGYRKALEFLIKDYAILNNEDKKAEIEKLQLMPVIKAFIQSARIQDVAERATWLGNDQTHYVRKWEKLTLEDLKKLIELTVHWISEEVLYKGMMEAMPEGKK